MLTLETRTPEETLIALRALVTVGRADGELDPRERRLVEIEAALHGVEVDVDALEPVAPEVVHEALASGPVRRALLQRMAVLALLDEHVAPEELATLRAFAAALGVDDPVVDQIEMHARGQITRLGLDLLRKGFLGKQMSAWVREHGLMGAVGLARGMAGLPDAAAASRWQALEALPEGTLGRELFAHFRRNGYPLPGEAGCAPEALAFHDVGHVLTGFGTDPHGEVQMAGFEGGFMGEDGFGVITLALFLFHLGTPLPRTVPARGAFDVDTFRAAYDRGRGLTTDLRTWDIWPWVDAPLPQVRQVLGM